MQKFATVYRLTRSVSDASSDISHCFFFLQQDRTTATLGIHKSGCCREVNRPTAAKNEAVVKRGGQTDSLYFSMMILKAMQLIGSCRARGNLAFLVCGDFHARSRFARSTIPGKNWDYS